ncbi:hypothetical protein [Sphingomonas sp.]|uniref:hypothetical protein n=1 Tax=Sphingomonas sp. TaxID=28214 RepID=UPI003BAC810A
MTTAFRFTKGGGKEDRLDVLRDGSVAETLACPKQRIIPHDMVHFAVEDVLDRCGFLTRVAHGEAADFRMEANAESDGVERLVEVFQGDGWSGGTTPPDAMLDLYHVTCDARSCPPLPVDGATIIAIRARIADLTAQWDAVAVGDSLTLTFAQRVGTGSAPE